MRDAHQAVWDALGRLERLVVLAVARQSGSRLADEHRVARSSLHEMLTRLVGEEQHLRREPDGTPRFVDPLLAHWLVRR